MRSLTGLFHLPRFRNAYVIRGALVWAGLRLASAVMGVLSPNVLEEAFILAVVPLAVFLDARRRGEDVFLGNLGISSGVIAGYALPLAALMEVVV
jgi:hypothetical protein